MGAVDNNSMLLLQKSLDYAWQKQRMINMNIANAETPGYKARYLTFEDELKHNLRGTEGKYNQVRAAIKNSHIRVKTRKEESMRLDGNNVNTDVENIELARTQLQYEYLIRQMNDQIARLRIVIEGR